MNNKKLYKDTFDQIVMSDEALRKVENMSLNSKKNSRVGFRCAVALAAVALAFVASNVAVYAATGSTLVEKVAVYINGEKVDNSKLKSYVDEQGNMNYELQIDEDEDSSAEIRIENEFFEEEENADYEMQVEEDGEKTAEIHIGDED